MNKTDDQGNDRLEHLLRRWGADQAASKAETARAPVPARYRSGTAAAVRRWLPLAAAAALLIVSGTFFYASFAKPLAGRAGGIPNEREVVQLRSELGRVMGELRKGRADLSEAQRQVQQRDQQFEAQVAQLRQTFAAEKTKLVTETESRIATFNKTIRERQDQLETALGLVKNRENKLADRKMVLTETRKQLEQLRREFKVEVARLRQAEETAVGARRDLEKNLEAIRAQVASISTAFSSLYLTTAGPDWHGLPERQLLARQSGIIERGSELRKKVRGESTRMLFDTLEVLLTRLDLLDPQSTDELASFAALLDSIDLVRRIDVVLTSGREDPFVRAWLIETRLILGEVESVG